MEIFLNGDSHQVDANIQLAGVLEKLNYHTKKGIAVGVNNVVIKRDEWHKTILEEGDKVLIISATKGG